MASIRILFAVLLSACIVVGVLSYADSDKWNRKNNNKERYPQEQQKRGDRRESESSRTHTESETYLRDDEPWSGKQQSKRKPSSPQRWQQDSEPVQQKQSAQKSGNPKDTRRKDHVSKTSEPQRKQNVDSKECSKCKRKACEQPISDYSQCQQYVVDPYKLSVCELKAAEMGLSKREPASSRPTEGEVDPKPYPHCERYADDQYKLEKCERKAQKMSQYIDLVSSQSNFLECQKYASDPFKFSICQEKAKELSQARESLSPLDVDQKTQSSAYPHCESYSYDLYKLAKCELKAAEFEQFQKEFPPLSEEERVEQNPAFIHCQKYSWDPFKQAKCESKARYWISIINAPHHAEQTSGEEQPSSIHPQCLSYTYDPYKLAKCEYNVKKYSNPTKLR